MRQVGEKIGGGAVGDASWELTYVGGVGRGGVGKGVYNWQIVIRKNGKEHITTWMAGDDEEAAIHYAEFSFKEDAGIPPHLR
ncbi:hypothetical protein JY651_44740 [Pyxidicoccus parkwayensis]|uniref:Uncharacterized protein n=1 Tax=Pyxidicoccus parkwayensis TaxID=2813578 RepID=A0ABX7NTE8_9BACT|nr:hypothetical protein [Pyxidicoccus parkwaysis]QSQ22166.1 hypothetical protein JY651_44740 [Pyxidicoccus parkwaysis]